MSLVLVMIFRYLMIFITYFNIFALVYVEIVLGYHLPTVCHLGGFILFFIVEIKTKFCYSKLTYLFVLIQYIYNFFVSVYLVFKNYVLKCNLFKFNSIKLNVSKN